jgi:PhnB protein
MTRAKSPIPNGYYSVTPQLTLDNAAEAIDWYKKALGAEEMGRMKDDEGRVMHAEIRIGNSRLMLNDVMTGKGPKAFGGSPASFYVYVEDADSLFNRAIAAGGRVHGNMGALADQFWGDRSGTLLDPFGYQWTIATRKEDLTPQEMEQRRSAWMKTTA